MAYVYQHIRLDTDEVFYIGIGSDTDGKYKRAYTKNGRTNPHWNHIVNKVGYRVEILKDCISREEACEEEIRLIKQYGRENINDGKLVNLTDGGEGIVGAIFSEEAKQKISKAHKGRKHSEEFKQKLRDRKHSEETRKKISNSNKGKIPSEESILKRRKAILGRTASEETKQKMSEVRKGKSKTDITKQKMTEAKLLFWKIKKINTKPPKPHQFF